MKDERDAPSRRRVLGTMGLTLAGAVTGTSVASANQESYETVDLDGFLQGWLQTPEATTDEEAERTLNLEAGKTYEIRWRNGDGIDRKPWLLSGRSTLQPCLTNPSNSA